MRRSYIFFVMLVLLGHHALSKIAGRKAQRAQPTDSIQVNYHGQPYSLYSGIRNIDADLNGIKAFGIADDTFSVLSALDFRDTGLQVTADLNNAYLRNRIYAGKVVFRTVVFNNTTFDSVADFEQATFEGNADFSSSDFRSPVVFRKATFDTNSNANFEGVIFYSTDSFSNSTFNSPANFRKARFARGADFSSVLFTQGGTFENDTFKAPACFSGATFRAPMCFDTVLTDTLDLSHAVIQTTIQFRKTTVTTLLSLEGASVTSKALLDFHHATLPQRIDMSHMGKIYNDIDLTTADLSGAGRQKIKINIFGSDISKIHLDYTHFELYFPEKEDGRDVKPEERFTVYEALLRNFKARGQFESYRLLDIEYRRQKDESNAQWLSTLNGWWWNFGYEKERIFLHMLLFLFLFTTITFFIINYLNQHAYTIVLPDHVPPFQRGGFLLKSYQAILKARQARTQRVLESANRRFHRYPGITNFLNNLFDARNERVNVVFVLLLLIAGVVIVFNFAGLGPYSSVKLVGLLNATEQNISYVLMTVLGALLLLSCISVFVKGNSINSVLTAWARRFWFSFIYTANIFFPVFLKYEKIQYKSKLGILYVMIVYLTGLLCIGYIANFVLQK